MITTIQNQVTLGPSDQFLTKRKPMKEFTKFQPGIIEIVKINTKKGEQLYRELAELTKLDSVLMDQVIADINPETWRKRRAGLTPLANYLKKNNINTSTLLGNKPDVELDYALDKDFQSNQNPDFQPCRTFKYSLITSMLKLQQLLKIFNRLQWLQSLPFARRVQQNRLPSACPEYCSHQLTAIIRRAGIISPQTGPTTRHTMMTILRAAGKHKPK
ncbi:MAG: hypothetical protein EZS28_022841 [Streblomastix strix]|uniref:Uncharacterized protein n=1 Tax=Streblomastix strix TaxID=222440 RepID=A0A5J4VGT0_9EUKA|nr:MAG: hypothetical protein EZS28_022841 [Streblomastix strix]